MKSEIKEGVRKARLISQYGIVSAIMPRIYRHEEIISSPKATPETRSASIGYLQTSLTSLLQSGDISGAFLYGSAIFDPDASIGDIDLLMTTPVITDKTSRTMHTVSEKIFRMFGVPVDVSCFTEHDLATAKHNYYRKDILDWLTQQTNLFPEYVIGKNPIDFIAPVDQDPLRGVDVFFKNQTHSLLMTYMKGYYPDVEGTLEQIVNLPHKLGRAALWALQLQGYTPPNFIPDLKKNTIRLSIKKLWPGKADLQQNYEELTWYAERYDYLVDEVRTQGIGQEEYAHLLRNTLHDTMPTALTLATSMQAALKHAIECGECCDH